MRQRLTQGCRLGGGLEANAPRSIIICPQAKISPLPPIRVKKESILSQFASLKFMISSLHYFAMLQPWGLCMNYHDTTSLIK